MIPTTEQKPDLRVSVTHVKVHELDDHWDEMVKLLSTIPGVCDRYTMADIRKWHDAEEMQAWRIFDVDSGKTIAVFCTEAHDWPSKRVLAIPFIAGHDMERWLGFLPALERFAKDEGFDEVELSGRPGWGKVTGYEERYRVFTKDITS
jgi:hypothetical protein